jgi:NADPH-dependent 2,4-dienoyl-CoA reductase/sulfur reductase-like enzyme
MPDYRYLIVGGGMTAAAAAEGIREADAGGSIGMVGAEPHPPYDRPPLSKALWKGKPLETIWRRSDLPGLTFHQGLRITRIDLKAKQAADDRGTVYRFEKLLLATGGTPRHLPFGGEDLIYFRTLDDYRSLRDLSGRGGRFAVVGGGFIGSEVAAALAMNGKETVLLFPGETIGGRLFPPDLGRFLNDYYRGKGVEVLPGETAEGLVARSGRFVLRTRRPGGGAEREVDADGVVAGIGIDPEVTLARAAGLVVEDGIRVDRSLKTSSPDVFAAGDVASFYNPVLGKWLRAEHEDNANTMGRMAGRAMAGEQVAYDHLPFFYSDLFDLGYEAVGEVDARLTTFSDWKEPFREGVIYYLRDQRVRGVLLWNVWGKVDAARQLISEPGPFGPEDLRGRISG